MVVQGGFSLQLVDAVTQEPLNEYCGPSGAVYYAEATPGGEYFLRFQVLSQEEDKASEDGDMKTAVDGAKERGMMYFRPSVDGKDLGFYTNLTHEDGARDVGLWTYVNGIGINQALKFETADTNNKPPSTVVAGTVATASSTVSEEESSGPGSTSKPGKTTPPLLHMGNVQVQIFKAIFTGNQKRVYSNIPSLTQEETVMAGAAVSVSASSSLQEEEEESGGGANAASSSAENAASSNDSDKIVEEALRMVDSVPALRSREGAARFEQKFAEECPTYKPGDLLETITIHYGSATALVHAGIMLPEGTVPQYVGVSSAPRLDGTSAEGADQGEGANTITEGKHAASSPLYDAVSSTHPAGSKRPQDSGLDCATSDDGVKPPATKKACREEETSESMSATVVSSK